MSEAHVPLQVWSMPLAATFALAITALLYFRGWLRLRAVCPTAISGGQLGVFICGVMSVAAAVNPPVATLDHQLLFMHMVQHLLLMTFAPLLILLGAPVKTLLYGMPHGLVQVMGRLFQLAGVHHVLRAMAHPALCWFVAAGALVVWHIPSIFMLGLRSQSWHGIEQASFLATGLLFWWPIVQPWPMVSKWPESSMLLYLFLATLPCDILSGFLVFCDRVVYPVFLSSAQSFGLSALEDQQCAGALMWTCVTVVYLIAAAIVTARLLSTHGSQEYAILQSEMQAIALRKSDAQRMDVV